MIGSLSAVQIVLGLLVISFLMAYALGVTYHAGRLAERGVSGSIQLIFGVIAGAIAVYLGFAMGIEAGYAPCWMPLVCL